MSQSVSLVVAPTTENVRLVGICTGALASSVLGPDAGARVELCVAEALNNVVEHAYANLDATAHNMAIEINLGESALTIKVIDHGAPAPEGLFDEQPELVFDVDNLDSLPEGGMGLFIIHDVMNDVKYESEDGSNTLVMRKEYEGAAL